MSKLLTLAAIAASATDDGTWVNDPFEAVVKNTKHGQAGGAGSKSKPSKCVLVDPKDPNSILGAAWFGGNFPKFEDKIIRVSGNGTKVSSYNGKAEVTIGNDAVVEIIGDAPKQMGPGPGPGPTNPPPANPPPNVDPVTFFHREMAKQSLGYLHCLQYAQDIAEKSTIEVTDPQFQACVSSLYIEGNRRGLFTKVPKLRELDANNLPIKFVPPAPDPAAVEAERARKAAEAEAHRKAVEAEQAAEAARKAANTKPAAAQENLDEDVPF